MMTRQGVLWDFMPSTAFTVLHSIPRQSPHENYSLFGIEPSHPNPVLCVGFWDMLDEAAIKDLCEKISQEVDTKRAADLLASLRLLIEAESDETRLRIRQIMQHYRNINPELTPEKPRGVMSLLTSLMRGQQVPPLDN